MFLTLVMCFKSKSLQPNPSYRFDPPDFDRNDKRRFTTPLYLATSHPHFPRSCPNLLRFINRLDTIRLCPILALPAVLGRDLDLKLLA
jgi:hypothetical protein